MDRALAAAAGVPERERSLVRSYGLKPDLLAVTQVWQRPCDVWALVATKGAPEAVVGLCRLESEAASRVRATVEAMASRGLRVLGVASAQHAVDGLPAAVTPISFDFRWIGPIGLGDPLRREVPQAVAECRTAGIRIIMITGDYPATAKAIARAAGLNHDLIVTGAELAGLSDAAKAERVRQASVFARIQPQQKLEIVKALQARGEVVTMTGDGVNDAPSLKVADIGIAMGGRGTDVAREASSIVLLDNDFGSIVRTIRHGRRIYDNLRKAMSYIVAVHIPIAGLALLPLLSGLRWCCFRCTSPLSR
jgi:Ca2+-transporting ATPase